METTQEHAAQSTGDALLDRRLNDLGWGLLLILTGGLWLLPADTVPPGAWLFGVAAILLGVNVMRYVKHVAVNGFSVVLGVAALVAGFSQVWRTDPPLVALFLIVIGAGLVARPLLAKTA